MRKPWIGGNWKMHKDAESARATASKLKTLVEGTGEEVETILFPPFPLIPTVADAVAGTDIRIGAQTMSEHESGAFTGEVSGAILTSLGCHYVLVGHSERRHVFGETNEMIHNKLVRALASQLSPVLCVGETLAEREAGRAKAVVEAQVESGFAGVSREDATRVTVAYEPVWAIGTDQVATPAQAVEMHGMIRGLLSETYDHDYGQQLRVPYGGSVKPENIETLIGEEEIDGALVGGASLEAESLAELVMRSRLATKK